MSVSLGVSVGVFGEGGWEEACLPTRPLPVTLEDALWGWSGESHWHLVYHFKDLQPHLPSSATSLHTLAEDSPRHNNEIQKPQRVKACAEKSKLPS